MEKIKTGISSNWRKFLSVLFVCAVFVMPATKSIFAKFFHVSVEAGNKNNKNKSKKGGTKSVSVPSVSSPHSNSTASPMSNTHSHSNGNSFASGGKKVPNPK